MFASKNQDLGLLFETYLSKQDTTLHYMGYRVEELINVSRSCERFDALEWLR